MPLKIIVGPEAMRVERNGFCSRSLSIGELDTPDVIRSNAQELWEEIKPIVSHVVWMRHRYRMARLRRISAIVQDMLPGPYFAGPNPFIVSTKEWGKAKHGEFVFIPIRGVAPRVIRSNPAVPKGN